uniref:Uncharacterized protein n=1 Tax=Medicago truncatula TaxID=3880 RepID=I3T348_MEDTR|nr:unknown [Medicago truncatula]
MMMIKMEKKIPMMMKMVKSLIRNIVAILNTTKMKGTTGKFSLFIPVAAATICLFLLNYTNFESAIKDCDFSFPPKNLVCLF